MRSLLIATLLFAPSLAEAQTTRFGRVDPEVGAGIQHLQAGRLTEAMDVLGQAVRDNPNDAIAWYHYGLAQHTAGELDDALVAHMMATHLAPSGNSMLPGALYNTACAHALLGRPEFAFRYLHQARNARFGDVNLLRSDSDLASLAEDPRFKAFANDPSLRSGNPATRATTVGAVTAGGTGGVECGSDGTLFIADFKNQVWRITPEGERTVLATGFTKAADCTLDGDGNLLQVDHGQSKVWRIAPDGSKSELPIEGLSGPVGIDTDSGGDVYVTNFRAQAIQVLDAEGHTRVLTVGGFMNGPNGIAISPDDRVFVVNYNDGIVMEILEEGTQRIVAVLPGGGNGHIAWHRDALAVTDRVGNRVYSVTPDGVITLIAGNGTRGVVDGAPAQAQFALPNGIAISPDGNSIYINDKADPTGSSWVLRRIALEPR